MNKNQKYCKVIKCRFPSFHTTSGHKCGSCNNYGHGLIECMDPRLFIRLNSYLNEYLPIEEQCKFGGCKTSKYHTSEAHHCLECNSRLHSVSTCPQNQPKLQSIETTCPICKKINTLQINQQKIYGLSDICCICLSNNVEVFLPNCGHVCMCYNCFLLLNKKDIDVFDDIRDESFLINQNYNINELKSYLQEYPSYIEVHEGMGCTSIIRRLNIDSQIEGMFVHSDDIYSDIKTVKIKDFINGYCHIMINDIIEHRWTGK
jgi:hypothetical protein